MAKSERLQIQKLRNYFAPDEQNFALVLFEDEERYSVIEVDQIKEKHYGYNQIINVLWGKGKEAKYFPAKLLQCGTKEECEKASLDLSFSQDTCATASDKESDREEPHPTLKRKRDGEILLTKNKKGTDHACKSADASWKASIEEEQRRLDSVLNGSQTKERFQRSPLTSKLASTSGEHFQRSHPQSEHVMVEVEPRLDLSAILSRLDKIEGKLDTLLHRHSSKFVPVTPPISRSGSPLPVVVKESNHGAINISEEESEDSAIVYNDIDLLALKAPPKEPTRYATRIAGVVFSKEELLGGMIPPLNDKYARTPLDPERIEIMRKYIAKKYTQKILEKMWGDIRRAVNQKCNDLRKKSKE